MSQSLVLRFKSESECSKVIHSSSIPAGGSISYLSSQIVDLLLEK